MTNLEDIINWRIDYCWERKEDLIRHGVVDRIDVRLESRVDFRIEQRISDRVEGPRPSRLYDTIIDERTKGP